MDLNMDICWIGEYVDCLWIDKTIDSGQMDRTNIWFTDVHIDKFSVD